MNTLFQIIGGSIIGNDHLRRKKNCQDAYRVYQEEDFSLVLVADGCSNQPQSEVGANLLLFWIEQEIRSHIGERVFSLKDPELLLRWLTQQVKSQMTVLMRGNTRQLLEYFSSTILGILILKEKTYIFGCGDGCYAINGNLIIQQPLEGNMPPYLVYSLLDHKMLKVSPDDCQLSLYEVLDTSTIEHMFLGTDGAVSLLQHVPLDTLIADEMLFANPYALGKLLFRTNRELVSLDWDQRKTVTQKGPLDDDTTLILLKREKQKLLGMSLLISKRLPWVNYLLRVVRRKSIKFLGHHQ